jgi:hypothetical protein
MFFILKGEIENDTAISFHPQTIMVMLMMWLRRKIYDIFFHIYSMTDSICKLEHHI